MKMNPETEAIFHEDIKYSCTAVIGKAVLFFGGERQYRQISQLTPLGLLRIGTLSFRFDLGTCLVMNNQLFLGFIFGQDKNCWSRLAGFS